MHLNVTIKNVSWPHFSRATLYRRNISVFVVSSDKEDDIFRHHDMVIILHLVQRGPQFRVRELHTWVVCVDLMTYLVHRQRMLVFLLEQLEQ